MGERQKASAGREMDHMDDSIEHLSEETVLIAGGGPVGLITATALAHYGLKSIILERNDSTTKWPKMDLTNVRSMELLRKLGLAEGIRENGVPATSPYNVYMTSGLHTDKPITRWEFPSVDELKVQYREHNDGSSPVEPWQRISQAVFEQFLKARCDKNPLISCRFGWKVEKSIESHDGVLVEATNVKTNTKSRLFTRYLVACDGASSRVRRDLAIPLDGGPVPGYALLVHFKSRDLEKLFKYGNFWHLFIFNDKGMNAAAICQDDKDTFTTHLLLPVDADHESIDSHDAVYRALGGMGPPFKVEIDEILVRSAYRHSIAVARKYHSPGGRVYLAGDSAHQNIPTGGYGMNMGIGDAFDIAWKLAAVIQKKAGPTLLESYEQERRPVALKCVQGSGEHMQVHMAVSEFLAADPSLLEKDSPDGNLLRQEIHQHYQANKGENTNVGLEMDIRHSSCVYPPPSQADGKVPSWNPASYTPNTFIGSRAPHVFLRDGKSIFDLYGQYWSLVEFSGENDKRTHSQTLLDAAKRIDMPIEHILLSGEDHAQKVWGVRLALIRPDGHVAWRGEEGPGPDDAKEVVEVVSGRKPASAGSYEGSEPVNGVFAATTKADSQVHDYELERMGLMQT